MISLMAAVNVSAAPRPESPSIRLAIAPFEGGGADATVARALATSIGRRAVDRVIGPDDFVAFPDVEATAEMIRRWAYNAAVDDVIVGRVSWSRDPEVKAMFGALEVVVRSGHSGAERARYELDGIEPAAFDAAVQQVAARVLADLGYVEPEAPDGVAVVPAGEGGAAGSVATAPGADSESGSGRGLDGGVGLEGLEEDAPIEIKADEAEIIDRGELRELVFRNNVFVRQGNTTMTSARLDAEYVKGESDPRRLVARGDVKIDQGDRHARCDQAVFVRIEQLLTCIGHAQLVQGCDIVRGDSIEFNLATDKARVDGAASIVIQPDDSETIRCDAGGNVL